MVLFHEWSSGGEGEKTGQAQALMGGIKTGKSGVSLKACPGSHGHWKGRDVNPGDTTE